jgi:hypothetical protein
MKILLDECVPVQVRNALVGHDVATAQRMGWSGIRNGELLQHAEQAGFDQFIVADKNLRYHQNLKGRKLAMLELWTNHRPTLENHLDKIKLAAERVVAGEYALLENPE